MQHSLNIPPHLKRVATLPCEMFMSENSLLISEIHLKYSHHFVTLFICKIQRTETSKMIVRYVKVIFFCSNISLNILSISFVRYMVVHVTMNQSFTMPHRT